MKDRSVSRNVLLTDKPSNWAVWVVGAGTLMQWILTGVFYGKLPPEIPLYFSLPFGVNQLAEKVWFLILPTLSLTSVVINYLLFKVGGRINLMVGQSIAWVTSLVVFMVVIAQIYVLVLVL